MEVIYGKNKILSGKGTCYNHPSSNLSFLDAVWRSDKYLKKEQYIQALV